MRFALTSRPPALVATGLAVGVLLAGCGGGSDTAEPGGNAAPVAPEASEAPEGGGDTSGLNYEGTLREPDATPRPIATGKKLVIISAGQASISSSVPVGAAEEAAKAAGWDVDVYDNQLNPANSEGLVRQAISSGADGIILQAIDCPGVKGPLQEAKAKGIQVVGIYAFDCNDPIFGGSDPALFSGSINYGADAQAGIGQFTEKYGADQAKAVIAATGGKAKVIFFNSTRPCCSTPARASSTSSRSAPSARSSPRSSSPAPSWGPNLQQKATSALLQHPEANVVKSPYTSATLLGIAPAVKQSGRANDIYVMGGEGFEPELDLLRTDQGVSAVNIAPSDWTGWAAVDTMNSLFAGTEPVDSGWAGSWSTGRTTCRRRVRSSPRSTSRASTRRPGAFDDGARDGARAGPAGVGAVQGLQRRVRPARRRPRRASERGARAAGRQRLRQVDADQGARRRRAR
jgi:ribose transport system substrate-binding protein